jgi:hypothetical protein
MTSEWDELLARLQRHLRDIETAIAQSDTRIRASRVLVDDVGPGQHARRAPPRTARRGVVQCLFRGFGPRPAGGSPGPRAELRTVTGVREPIKPCCRPSEAESSETTPRHRFISLKSLSTAASMALSRTPL